MLTLLRLYFSCEVRTRDFSATTKRNAIRERDLTKNSQLNKTAVISRF